MSPKFRIARTSVVFALTLLAACLERRGLTASPPGITALTQAPPGPPGYVSRGAIFGVIDYANDNHVDLDRYVLFGGVNFRLLNGEANLEAAQQLIRELNPGLDLKAKPDANGKRHGHHAGVHGR